MLVARDWVLVLDCIGRFQCRLHWAGIWAFAINNLLTDIAEHRGFYREFWKFLLILLEICGNKPFFDCHLITIGASVSNLVRVEFWAESTCVIQLCSTVLLDISSLGWELVWFSYGSRLLVLAKLVVSIRILDLRIKDLLVRLLNRLELFVLVVIHVNAWVLPILQAFKIYNINSLQLFEVLSFFLSQLFLKRLLLLLKSELWNFTLMITLGLIHRINVHLLYLIYILKVNLANLM